MSTTKPTTTKKTCSAEGCSAPAGKGGLCTVCRRRAARHGGQPGPRGVPHGRLGDEPLVTVSAKLPEAMVAALEATGAGSVSAAIRLVLEAWWRARQR